MIIKKKDILSAVILLIILIAIPVGIFVVRKITNLRPGAQTVPVNIYFSPSSGDIVNGTRLRVYANPSGVKTAFIKTVITFDRTKIQLTSEVATPSVLSDVIQKSTMAEANSSGRIVLVLAAPPAATLTTVAFEIANFTVNKTTSDANSALTVTSTDMQIVDDAAQLLSSTVTNANFVLNQASSTVTTTPLTVTPTTFSTCFTGLIVNDSTNASNWSMQQSINQGSVQFGDRDYTIATLPTGYAGLGWIRTANDSKSYTGATVATFTLTGAATVYVAHDDRIATKPSWMSGWTDTGAEIVNSEATPKSFSIYSKSFSAGTVSLGNNGSTGNNFYTILVRCGASATPTITPTPTYAVTSTMTPTSVSTFTPTPTYTGTNAVPTFYTTTLPAGTVGTSYSQQVQVRDTDINDTLSMTGTNLHTGLVVSNCNQSIVNGAYKRLICRITGTPTVSGTRTITINVSDTKTVATKTYTLVIN